MRDHWIFFEFTELALNTLSARWVKILSASMRTLRLILWFFYQPEFDFKIAKKEAPLLRKGLGVVHSIIYKIAD